jgi:hypothetical protein
MKPTKRLACLGLTFIAAHSAYAGDNFKIEIVYPDSEQKTFLLLTDGLPLPMKNSKWKCVAVKDKEGFDVSCELKGSKAAAGASIPCNDHLPMFNSFHVYDSLEKHYNIILSCNMR